MVAARLTLVAGALALWAVAAWAQLVGDAARVNGVSIGAERLERSFDELLREKRINIAALRNPAQAKRLKREALDALIDQELLWQQSQLGGAQVAAEEVEAALRSVRAGYSSRQAFEGRLRAEGYTAAGYAEHLRRLLSARKVLDTVASGVRVDEAEARAFFDANRSAFDRPAQVRLRHLLLRLEPGASAAQIEDTRSRMREIAERARAGADFAALAREHSAGGSAARGGDLGWVQRHELVAALADVAFALPAGQVSGVIELPEGLHLLRCEDVVAAAAAEFEAQRERIVAHLGQRKAEAATAAYLERLRAQARIEVLVPLPPVAQSADESFAPSRRAREVQPGP